MICMRKACYGIYIYHLPFPCRNFYIMRLSTMPLIINYHQLIIRVRSLKICNVFLNTAAQKDFAQIKQHIGGTFMNRGSRTTRLLKNIISTSLHLEHTICLDINNTLSLRSKPQICISWLNSLTRAICIVTLHILYFN